jgi:hypothetical protein
VGALNVKRIFAVEGDAQGMPGINGPRLADTVRSSDRILLTSLRHVNRRAAHFLLQRIQIGAVGGFVSNISAVGLTASHKTVAELPGK